MDHFEACIVNLRIPVTHRRAVRTMNLWEHLFVEERRRLGRILTAFGERRQIEAVNRDLDEEHETASTSQSA